MPTLTLIRGLPGSGKSTVAYPLGVYLAASWYEADMFFKDAEGTYTFDKSRIKDAHAWCQDETRSSMAKSKDVIVSNTFTQMWEMQPYLNMVKFFCYDVQVIECKGNFGSIHGVPEATITKMKDRWEEYNA